MTIIADNETASVAQNTCRYVTKDGIGPAAMYQNRGG